MKHESCCTTVTAGGGTTIGKYQVTAGRARAFIERWKGDLKKWAATNPPGWNHGWNDELPASMDDVAQLMGPNGKRGCNIGNAGKGARTYWQAEGANGDNNDKSDFSKDQLDEKVLNRVTWHMVQAVCVSDGGRLATTAELVDLMTTARDGIIRRLGLAPDIAGGVFTTQKRADFCAGDEVRQSHADAEWL